MRHRKILTHRYFLDIYGQALNLQGDDGLSDLPDLPELFEPLLFPATITGSNNNIRIRYIKVLPNQKVVASASTSLGFNQICPIDELNGGSYFVNASDSTIIRKFLTFEDKIEGALQLPNGNVVYYGSFLYFLGEERYGIAMTNSSGTLLPWAPKITSPQNFNIRCASLYGQNKFVIGGTFSFIDGESRRNLAVFDVNTLDLDPFNASVGTEWQSVYSLAIFNDEVIIVGNYSIVNGENYIGGARISLLTSQRINWIPSGGNYGYDVKIYNNYAYFAYSAANFGGVSKPYLCRANLNESSVDMNWPSGSGPNRVVQKINYIDGKLIIGGQFTSVSGVSKGQICFINEITGDVEDITLSMQAYGANYPNYAGIRTILVNDDNSSIIIAGQFTSVLGSTRDGVCEINFPSLTLTSKFENLRHCRPGYYYESVGVAPVNEDTYIVYGDFVGGTAVNTPQDVVIINSDTSQFAETQYFNGVSVSNILIIGDIMIVCERNNLRARSLSTGLSLWTLTANLNTLVIGAYFDEQNGELIVVGSFSSLGGISRSKIAKVSLDGVVLDWTASGSTTGSIENVILCGSKILVSGNFTNLCGSGIAAFGAIDSFSGIVENWYPITSSLAKYFPVKFALREDFGVCVLVGYFSSFLGVPRTNICSINISDLSLTDWNPGSSGVLTDVKSFGGGVLVCGQRGTLGGVYTYGLGYVSLTTGTAIGTTGGALSPVDAWGSTGRVETIEFDNEYIYIGGEFVPSLPADIKSYYEKISYPARNLARMKYNIGDFLV